MLLAQVFEDRKSKVLTAQHNEAQLMNSCLSLEYLNEVTCFKGSLLCHREPLGIWENCILKEFADNLKNQNADIAEKSHALVSGSQDTHTQYLVSHMHILVRQ